MSKMPTCKYCNKIHGIYIYHVPGEDLLVYHDKTSGSKSFYTYLISNDPKHMIKVAESLIVGLIDNIKTLKQEAKEHGEKIIESNQAGK